jgi:hypothetical protein
MAHVIPGRPLIFRKVKIDTIEARDRTVAL